MEEFLDFEEDIYEEEENFDIVSKNHLTSLVECVSLIEDEDELLEFFYIFFKKFMETRDLENSINETLSKFGY